eukprot:SAG31_NODE_25186_length_466_cov_1.062670_1_plen_121_part_10
MHNALTELSALDQLLEYARIFLQRHLNLPRPMADSIDDLRASFGSMRTSFGTLTGAPLLPASPSADAASRSADLAGTTNLPDLAAGSSGAGLPTIDPLQIAAAFATDSAPTASKIWSGGHI